MFVLFTFKLHVLKYTDENMVHSTLYITSSEPARDKTDIKLNTVSDVKLLRVQNFISVH